MVTWIGIGIPTKWTETFYCCRKYSFLGEIHLIFFKLPWYIFLILHFCWTDSVCMHPDDGACRGEGRA